MKNLLASAAMAALFAAPVYAQTPQTSVAPEVAVTVEAPTSETQAALPANTQLVISKTTVEVTPDATIEQTSETIIPVSDRPALNPENPIAPEVQAIVDTKKHYTTADLANAQLAAVLATPPSEPTTTIITTRTIPKTDG